MVVSADFVTTRQWAAFLIGLSPGRGIAAGRHVRGGGELCQGVAMVRYVLNDRYELRSMLGSGGMAAVWQATDRWLGRMVAVKVLHERVLADPTVAGRFEREARMVAGLAHPNIVALHDVGADSGVPYLVMELVSGRSLAALLSAGPLDIAGAVGIAAQVCAALEAASEAGIVHRDIKPANILITDDGRVKVCDFGIARVAGATRSELTGSAQMLGTSTYMAPEQVAGGAVDVRTDLYGLGCVLYAMLTGNPPFTGDSPMRIAWDHVERVPPPASAHRPVPHELDLLLQAMLAKFPADRPSDPATVRAALENLNLAPEPAPPSMAADPEPARSRRGTDDGPATASNRNPVHREEGAGGGTAVALDGLPVHREEGAGGGTAVALDGLPVRRGRVVEDASVVALDCEATQPFRVTEDGEAALGVDPKVADCGVAVRSGRARGGLLLTGLGTVVGAGVLAMVAATGAVGPGPQTAPERSSPPGTAVTSPAATTPDGAAAPDEAAPAGVAVLDEKAARDLVKKLEKENGGKAKRDNSEARRRLNDLRRAGKLKEAAYRAALAELDPPAM
ncbi:protein kinase [Actinoplanes hulinensis]|uniref:non-specific serine/threonine protein kinase n=1 Tax=Actinoplanes hulinensis TaxID=1144547 RepID=A0ABS7B8Z9_9ACTN|nr:protein kinase [Actinoplanes hulinensis]MBW6437536.1 protein kinase [Actinoplanes hulinensis]